MGDDQLKWHRSDRCQSDACAEVAFAGPDDIRVRDSKNPDVVLRFTKAEWDAFVGGARDGEFDVS